MKSQESTSTLSEEYLLSSYIAKCAEAAGFNGVIYPCIENKKYTNYVLFADKNMMNSRGISKYTYMLYLEEIRTVEFNIEYSKKREKISFNKKIDSLIEFIEKEESLEESKKNYEYTNLRRAVLEIGNSDLLDELDYLIKKVNKIEKAII